MAAAVSRLSALGPPATTFSATFVQSRHQSDIAREHYFIWRSTAPRSARPPGPLTARVPTSCLHRRVPTCAEDYLKNRLYGCCDFDNALETLVILAHQIHTTGVIYQDIMKIW